MTSYVYTPILKTKRGEAKALVNLNTHTKECIQPFFDVLALGEGALNGSDVQEHITKQALNIASCWKSRGLCYVDLFDVTPSARCLNGVHPATVLHNKIASEYVRAIPVVGLERDIAYKLAIREVVITGIDAIAFRLEAEDIQLPSMLVNRISSLVSEIGAGGLPLHIFMDFRSIHGISSDAVQLQFIRALSEIRRLAPARIVFASSAIVPDMASFKRNSLNRVSRTDFLTWQQLSERHQDVAYADYGVVHPDYFDFDPKLIKPAAKIRYTTDTEWIIVKGASWRDDTAQHHELSKALVRQQDFRGSDSWGGEYIMSAAAGRPKYGTLETWVSIDQNNHITHTLRQLLGTISARSAQSQRAAS